MKMFRCKRARANARRERERNDVEEAKKKNTQTAASAVHKYQSEMLYIKSRLELVVEVAQRSSLDCV